MPDSHRVHEVNCNLKTFEDAFLSRKQHDLRQDGDPRFAVGDILRLLELDPDQGGHSGRSLDLKITYILRPGIPVPCRRMASPKTTAS